MIDLTAQMSALLLSKRPQPTGDDPIARMAAHLLRGVTDPNIVVGPPLWRPREGEYFVVACSKDDFHTDVVRAERGARLGIERIRDGFLADLARRPGLIVHALDDEAKTIEACAAFWPCEAVGRIRTQFETERAFARMQARGLAPH